MAQSAIDGLYRQLTPDEQRLTKDYMFFLLDRRRKEQLSPEESFRMVDEILDHETGWDTEETMINDLASYRRKCMQG